MWSLLNITPAEDVHSSIKLFLQILSKIMENTAGFQFEDFVLDCSLELLDVANLSHTVRGDAVLVTRTISTLVSHTQINQI